MKNATCLVVIFVTILMQSSCSSNELISVTQTLSDYPIILKKGMNGSKITAVQIPLVYQMSYLSVGKIKLGFPSYIHNSLFDKKLYRAPGGTIYTSINGNLIGDEELQNIGIISKKIVIYTRHSASYKMNDRLYLFFQPYVQQMIKERKDTLHISSIQKLKKTHPEIINAFLQGDSILFRFYKGKSIFTRIFPVEVK